MDNSVLPLAFVRVKTTNDVNGNPRRGWLLTTASGRRVFVDEGYRGNEGLWDAYRLLGVVDSSEDASAQRKLIIALSNAGQIVDLWDLDITVRQYNDLKRGRAHNEVV